jgi:hypothetical protein
MMPWKILLRFVFTVTDDGMGSADESSLSSRPFAARYIGWNVLQKS